MENGHKKKNYLDKYDQLVRDYLDCEKKYHDYLSQFFSDWTNGRTQHNAIKSDNQAEFEKRKKIKAELEKKRRMVMLAQEKYLLRKNMKIN